MTKALKNDNKKYHKLPVCRNPLRTLQLSASGFHKHRIGCLFLSSLSGGVPTTLTGRRRLTSLWKGSCCTP